MFFVASPVTCSCNLFNVIFHYLSCSFTFALTRSLHEDGSKDDRTYDQSRAPSLADKYEYVMHGHVFRCDEHPNGKLFVSGRTSLLNLAGVVFASPGLRTHVDHNSVKL